jgi:hypothetical protein
MRGYDLFNFDTFELGASYLRWLHHEVVSPHEIHLIEGLVHAQYTWGWRESMSWEKIDSCRQFSSVELTDKFSIEAALQRDIAVIATVDAVAFLPGWEQSSDCQDKDQVRQLCGLPRYLVKPFLAFHEDTTALVRPGRRGAPRGCTASGSRAGPRTGRSR